MIGADVKNRKTYSPLIRLLAVYLFFVPLDFFPLLPGVSVSKFMVFLPLLGVIIEFHRFNFRYLNKCVLWLLAYLFLNAVSIMYSTAMAESISRTVTLTLNIGVILIMAAGQYSRDEIVYLLKKYALSGWLLLILTFLNINLGSRLTVMINGIEQDPNYLCGYFIFPLNYYLYQYIKTGRKGNIAAAFCMIIAPILTGSRGGLIALICSIFIMLLANGIIKKMYKVHTFIKVFITAALLIALLGILWQFVPYTIKIRYTPDFTIHDGGAGRFKIWESLLQSYKNGSAFNHLFGFGSATVRQYTCTGHVAHNLFLEALTELGILGLITLTSMYIYYLKAAYRQSKILFASFAGYLVMCLSMSLYSYKPIWNVILLTILGIKVLNDGNIMTDCCKTG